MTPDRRPTARQVLTVTALVVLGGLVLAWIVPPRYVEYGGGDEENYLANGVRLANGNTPAYDFLPDEWQDFPDTEREALHRAFLDADGRMFRLLGLPPGPADADAPTLDEAISRKKATVDGDGQIRIAHDNLYATFLGALVLIEDTRLPFLANDMMLIAVGLLFGLVVHQVVRRRSVAVVSAALFVALPSMIEAARVTRTETFASLLFLAFVWWQTRGRGESAWPGLLLVALWTTRHEFIVPLLLYLAWAAWRRRDGAWPVVLATVAAADLHPWGLAEAGELFPSSRDVFAELPTTPAWLLIPAFAVGRWVSGRLGDLSDRTAGALGRLGARTDVHRAFWVALVAGAGVAELLRRSLDVDERGWILFKGPRLSTVDVLVDSIGVPLLLLGVAGLVWSGQRLAGRIPFVVALVTLPHAYVLIRMGVSGEDLWSWSRRFHVVLYPVVLLGLALLLAELLDRAAGPKARRQAGWVATALAVVAAVPALLIHGDRPAGTAPTRADADGFHQAVDRLAADSVVILAPAFGSQKAQLPIRVFDDRWSFVVWDEEEAGSALATALPCLDRPLYVEMEVLELVEAAGGTARGDEVVLPARYNEGPGRDISLTEVVPPTTESASVSACSQAYSSSAD